MLATVCLLTAVLAAPSTPPYYFRRRITPADLQGKTLGEISIIRNTIYARAGNVFRKKWLKEYFASQKWYRGGGMDPERLSGIDTKNAEVINDFELAISVDELRARLQAWENPAGLDAGSGPAPASPVAREVEIALLREDLGIADPDSTSPLDNPPLLDKLVSVKQLEDLSPRELRLLRNMIYARRGRTFVSKDLASFFRRNAWYQPDPQFKESRLTPIDQKNIRMVQSVEDDARDAGFGDRRPGERFLMQA